MALQSIMVILWWIERIWELENQKKFQEGVIKILQSFVDQINFINHNQMEQLSIAYTRMEWIQYGLIFTLFLAVIIFVSIFRFLLLRIKALELKNK